MIIAPNLMEFGIGFRDDGYDVPDDYLMCLAHVVREYTAETVDQNDTTIPLAIRASASNPHRLADRKTLNVYNLKKLEEYLPHASAIIPATDGAFWLLFPCSATMDTGVESPIGESVWYFPAGAKVLEDGVNLGSVQDGWIRPALRGFDGYTGDPNVTPHPSIVSRNHPCGATYTNIRLDVTISEDVLKKLEIGTNNTNDPRYIDVIDRFVPKDPKTGARYVDALVCCGGYYWDKQSSDPGCRFIPSHTLRIFVASPTLTHRLALDGSIILSREFDSRKQLTETVLFPERSFLDVVFEKEAPRYPIGSAVVVLNRAQGLIMIVGGLMLRYGYHSGYAERTWAVRWTDYPSEHRYPISFVRLEAVVDYQDVPYSYDPKHTEKTCFRIYIRAREDKDMAVHKNEAGTHSMPINPEKKGKYYENLVPIMYPRVLIISSKTFVYGCEFFDTAVPPHAPAGTTFPTTGRVTGLNHLMSTIHAVECADGKQTCYHTPLVSCHIGKYYKVVEGGRYFKWYPLNISGGIGLDGGAVAIPHHSLDALLLIGGAGDRYVGMGAGLGVGTITSPDNVNVTNQDYSSTSITTIPFYGRVVQTSASEDDPFRFCIDTLRYDCLYSHAIQLGTSDFFVLPTSVLKYAYDPYDPCKTNATLVRTRKPLDKNSDRARQMGDIERHWYTNAHTYVSEVVGMPVIHEGPEKFSEETPYWYGHANPAKGSIGSITVTEGKEYWIYYLGNGDQPAKYFHIEIVTTAKSIVPYDGKMGPTRYNQGAPKLLCEPTLSPPGKWEMDHRTGVTGNPPAEVEKK